MRLAKYPFLAGTEDIHVRDRAKSGELFDLGKLHLSTAAIPTVKPLEVDMPKGCLTVVTGVSDSGKTALSLESLVPGLTAAKQVDAWLQRERRRRFGNHGMRI